MPTSRICESPIRGTDQTATGTAAGYARHYRRGEPACDDCLSGHNERSKKWVQDNPVARKAIDRRWYRSHQEQAKDAARRFREANPSYAQDWYRANRIRVLENNRRWDERNPGKRRAAIRAWTAANPEKVKGYYRRWRQVNSEKVAEFSRRRRARLSEATIVPFTQSELDQRMSIWGYACWMCGGPFESVDHVKPLAKGGAHTLSNLRPSCQPCNLRKSDKWFGVGRLVF